MELQLGPEADSRLQHQDFVTESPPPKSLINVPERCTMNGFLIDKENDLLYKDDLSKKVNYFLFVSISTCVVFLHECFYVSIHLTSFLTDDF